MTKESINRRSFLKKGLAATAGAALFPSIVPASALGRNGFVPPSDRIVMGAIGVGGMGTHNMTNFLSKKEVQFVAVCDVDERHNDRAKGLINKQYKNQDARSYGDYQEFLGKEKLDAVMMALPDHWHGIIGVSVAQKGLDIYGEKPLARTIMESRAIVDAAHKNNIVWQTGSWQRSQKQFRDAAELVRNGVIGKVSRVEVGLPDGRTSIGTPPIQTAPAEVDLNRWLGPAPKVPFRGILHFDWRWMMDYSGGQLTDWAGHHVDIAHWGLGFDKIGPVEVDGKGVYPVDGIYNVPVEYVINCKYENGVEMTIANQSHFTSGRKGKLWQREDNWKLGMGAVWYGEKGWIQVNRGGIWASDPELLKTPSDQFKEKLYVSHDHWQNFLDCVKSRKETITPVETAHRSISVALIGEIAMLTGEKLKWDYKQERFTNSAYANRLLARPFRAPWQMPQL
ncbi:MAG: Gfo/Idh/MocA family oxidoreductase [Marinilabiliaceae bacterium]|nr:Gfo/Idh/MocA family oxidoreductase [Marinilabiliaceae bacterium]